MKVSLKLRSHLFGADFEQHRLLQSSSIQQVPLPALILPQFFNRDQIRLLWCNLGSVDGRSFFHWPWVQILDLCLPASHSDNFYEKIFDQWIWDWFEWTGFVGEKWKSFSCKHQQRLQTFFVIAGVSFERDSWVKVWKGVAHFQEKKFPDHLTNQPSHQLVKQPHHTPLSLTRTLSHTHNLSFHTHKWHCFKCA